MENCHPLINAITKKRSVTLEKFLVALSINHIGNQNAYLVADYLIKTAKSLKLPLKAPRDLWRIGSHINQISWQTINAFGPKIGESLEDYFSHQENKELLEKLSSNGITLILKPISHHLSWHNFTFVFTGTLKNLSREQAENEVKILGGKDSDSVTSKTNYLVIGDNPGSKYAKAANLGVKILKEEEFIALLDKAKNLP